MTAFTESCVPSGCNCFGHRMPGVSHVAPCCDRPHVDAALDTAAPEEYRHAPKTDDGAAAASTAATAPVEPLLAPSSPDRHAPEELR